jgi:hypothetical protein
VLVFGYPSAFQPWDTAKPAAVIQPHAPTGSSSIDRGERPHHNVACVSRGVSEGVAEGVVLFSSSDRACLRYAAACAGGVKCPS